jgi:hypothetical protein
MNYHESIHHEERMVSSMSLSQFEWDRYVGTHMTPVDAVHTARSAGQTFEEYATGYAQSAPPSEITTDELVAGMVADMNQAAYNLASFRVTGNTTLSPHAEAIFAANPDDPGSYYAWVETADEHEILAKVAEQQPS